MKAIEIQHFINEIKNIPEISSEFDYIGYEIPKSAKNGSCLVISDLDEGGRCYRVHLIEFRVISGIEKTALKTKNYCDIIAENISKFHHIGYSKISLYNESRIEINSDGRFEKVVTYEVY